MGTIVRAKIKSPKIKSRLGRKVHVRKRVFGVPGRPRVSLFKSNQRLYLQVIDDLLGRTLVSVSSLEKDFHSLKPNIAGGSRLGEVLGERLKERQILKIVFDRNGYKYHGVVKAVADAVRCFGIEF